MRGWVGLIVASGCSVTPAVEAPAQAPVQVEIPVSDGFDYPVGAPNGEGFYDAQPFGRNTHLGSDWNGLGGGNTDLGEPVTNIANGRVRWAADKGRGWGWVVVVTHRLSTSSDDPQWVESVYAHLDRVDVQAGQVLQRGASIGTIGDAHGAWPAHLHFEIRKGRGQALGRGYGPAHGQVDPTAFINAHRPKPPQTES